MKHENTEASNRSSKEKVTLKDGSEKIDGTDTKTDSRMTQVLALLIAVQESGAVLFHDQYDEAYIAYYGDGSRVSKIDSKHTKMWLTRHAHIKLNTIPSTDTISRAVQSLSAKALFEGREHALDVRSVQDLSGLWYDLGGRAVHVTEKGWEVPDDSPLIFKRFPHQKKQVKPISGGDLGLLLNYINITNDQDRLLFLVYVVAAFIPGYPHPLLILHGAQGAGKTTPMKIMKELIDPSELAGLSSPKNIDTFVQTMSHHSFMFYDNLSKMPEWFSDALARAATGDSFGKRGLYTDDDDVIYRFQRAISLNGINQVVYKSDLLDRSILLKLERISPEKRKESQAFWADFERDKPFILGAIFDVLYRALALYPTIKLDRLPRMADFAHWGYAISEAAGYSGQEFIKAYSRNIEIQHDEAIEASPTAQVIIEFMSDQNKWEGTPARLYSLLAPIAWNLSVSQSRGWPRDAARLGRALTIIAPNLLATGIELERSRGKDRLITIRKIAVATDGSDMAKDPQADSGDSTSASSVQNKLL